MTRVYAVVEGASEEIFLKSMVVEHLAHRSVWLTPMQVLRGGGARGGGRSWQPWQRHLTGLLRHHRDNDVRVTTMLDLYAIPNDTPGWSAPGSTPIAQRADAMLAEMAARIGDYRFMPYISVHEFEAFLFVELDALARVAPDIVRSSAYAELQQSTAGAAPEDINDGLGTAPSKRILASTAGFRKTIHGIQAVQEIGLDRLRAACPRFHDWLIALESRSL